MAILLPLLLGLSLGCVGVGKESPLGTLPPLLEPPPPTLLPGTSVSFWNPPRPAPVWGKTRSFLLAGLSAPDDPVSSLWQLLWHWTVFLQQF